MSDSASPAIPGFIEPIEQKLFYKLAKSMMFEADDAVAEFGAFFGLSTSCIARGLTENNTFQRTGGFVTYDAFDCVAQGGFAELVLNKAREAGLDSLIVEEGDRLNFIPVFDHFLSEHLESKLLDRVQVRLDETRPKAEKFALLHIDSPKYYTEFRPILLHFLPRIRRGGFIVFQDFFYHWSASLIAVAGLLLERGHLKAVGTAASSLVCEVMTPITQDDADDMDEVMQQDDQIPLLIDAAIEECQIPNMDRRELFFPRLHLAKMQWLFEQGRHVESSKVITGYLNQEGKTKLTTPILNDFLELFGHGFSMRRLYDIENET